MFKEKGDSPQNPEITETSPETNEIKIGREAVQETVESKKELTPEQQDDFLSTLETRFQEKPENYKRIKNNFEEIRAALEANPTLMWSLAQMEKTGGKPDIIAVEDDAFIFCDCSFRSPRQNLNYYEVIEMAKKFGVDMIDENTYLQMGKTMEFEDGNYCWLKNDKELKYGLGAYGACFNDGYVDLYVDNADEASPCTGWRGTLRVPR